MKLRYVATALFSIFAAGAVAQAPGQSQSPGEQPYPEWSDVDKDNNGQLSVEEARTAFPDLEIGERDDNGILSRAEAEDAIEGLSLGPNEQSDRNAPVGMREYRTIVQAMERREEGTSGQRQETATQRPGGA